MRQITLMLCLAFIMVSCNETKKEDANTVDNSNTETQSEMQKNLSKYVTVKLTSDLSTLSEKERQMLPILTRLQIK